MLSGVLVALLIAGLAPFVAAAVDPIREQIARRRAFRRLQSDPLIYPGVVFEQLLIEGREGALLGPCVLHDLAVGRAEVRSVDGKQAMSFTGRELEKLHPVVRVGRIREG